jgi:hypothetical protein
MSNPTAVTIEPTATTEDGLLALIIEHNHGTDVTVHRSREGALAKVDQFVSDWWDTEMGEDEPMPEDPAAARQAYFEAVGDENYLITDTAIFD